MLSFIADLVGAYFVAKKIRDWRLGLGLCLLIGCLTAVGMSVVNQAATDRAFDLKDFLQRTGAGASFHAVITVLAWALWSARRSAQRKPKPPQQE